MPSLMYSRLKPSNSMAALLRTCAPGCCSLELSLDSLLLVGVRILDSCSAYIPTGAAKFEHLKPVVAPDGRVLIASRHLEPSGQKPSATSAIARETSSAGIALLRQYPCQSASQFIDKAVPIGLSALMKWRKIRCAIAKKGGGAAD